MKIAVTGASGQLGQLLVKKRVPAENIVALARNTKKASELGIEVRPFDYDQPQNLPKAIQEINRPTTGIAISVKKALA